MSPSSSHRARGGVIVYLAAMLLWSGAVRADDHEGPHSFPAVPAPVIGTDGSVAPISTLFPLDSVPQLSSRPGARVKLYLDFNGVASMHWGGFNVPDTPAYDVDGDPATFDSTEMDNIHQVWARVAEKYSPFDVDVTTIDPQTYEFNETVRLAIGGDSTWAGGTYGGYGYVNGFTGATSNTAFVFAKNLGKGLPKYVAEAAAHEGGHNFGLQHQSVFGPGGVKTDEYNRGADASAPIMGFSYYATRGLWWKGSATSPNSIQDDLSIISMNEFGYRPDDYSNDPAAAALLLSSNGTDIDPTGGVIERITDQDWFRFATPGGLISLRADVAPFGPMLDLSLGLFDIEGNQLFLADTDSLGEFINFEALAGEYLVAVSSHGGYGDVGQYTVSGSIVPEPAGMTSILVAISALSGRFRKRRAASPPRAAPWQG